jgi:TP901-1 family phage major tail protein
MATVINGIDNILYLRNLADDDTLQGARLSLQTTHSFSGSNDTTATVTKDGTQNSIGKPSWTLSMEVLASDDETLKIIKKAFNESKLLEVWSVNFGQPENTNPDNTSYFTTYARGYVTSFEDEEGAEDNGTISIELAINGIPQDGYCEVAKTDVESLQYAFTCLNALGAFTVAPSTSTLTEVGATATVTASRKNGVTAVSANSAYVSVAKGEADYEWILTANYIPVASTEVKVTFTADDGDAVDVLVTLASA